MRSQQDLFKEIAVESEMLENLFFVDKIEVQVPKFIWDKYDFKTLQKYSKYEVLTIDSADHIIVEGFFFENEVGCNSVTAHVFL